MTKHRPRIRLVQSRSSSNTPQQRYSDFTGVARDLSDSGMAVVAHPSGQVVFVPGLWIGEEARIRIVQTKKSVLIGQVCELITASPQRVIPTCQHHGFSDSHCGGCSWMFIHYQEQIRAKHQRIEKNTQKVFPDVPVNPVIVSSRELNYRVRAQFKTDGRKLGFLADGRHQIVDVKTCSVLTPHCQQILDELRRELPEKQWRPSKKKQWTTIDIEYSKEGAQVSVNQRLPFTQVNEGQNQEMHQWLNERLQRLPSSAKVIELFAGSGNLTQVLIGHKFHSIVAAEVVTPAIDHLTNSTGDNVVAEECDLFDERAFRQFWSKHQDAEVLVLDPPREGLKVKEGMIGKRSKLKEVIYISCDLSTLCRDLSWFAKQGFNAVDIQPLDMFPQTPHVEILVHLNR